MISVTRVFTFEAAHHLPYYEGDCRRPHGHSYKLEVEVSGPVQLFTSPQSISGMVLDFKDLKNLVTKYVLEDYDHQDLTKTCKIALLEKGEFAQATAEFICEDIANRLVGFLEPWVKLERVTVWETANSYATWRPDAYK